MPENSGDNNLNFITGKTWVPLGVSATILILVVVPITIYLTNLQNSSSSTNQALEAIKADVSKTVDELKKQIDELKVIVIKSSDDRWTRTQHMQYSSVIDDRLKQIEEKLDRARTKQIEYEFRINQLEKKP